MAVRTIRNITNFIFSSFYFQLLYVPLTKDCKLLHVEGKQFSIYKQKLLVSAFIHHAQACWKISQFKADMCTIGPYYSFMKMPSSFPFYFFFSPFLFMLARHESRHVYVLGHLLSRKVQSCWKHYTILDIVHSSITWKRLHFISIIFFVQLH